MVTVTDYSLKTTAEGKEFFVLIIQGGLSMVKSKQSGNFYVTANKCSVLSTFDEQTCKSLIGEKIPGTIQKQTCEAYEIADKETGEIIELSHRWSYLPEGASVEEAIFEGAVQEVI